MALHGGWNVRPASIDLGQIVCPGGSVRGMSHEKEEEARKAAKETGALLLMGPAGDVSAGPAGEAPEVDRVVEAEPAVEMAVADGVAMTAAQKRLRRH